jgi:hypothetical protein
MFIPAIFVQGYVLELYWTLLIDFAKYPLLLKIVGNSMADAGNNISTQMKKHCLKRDK